MLNAMTKPEGVPQEQWDAQIGELKGTLSSTLGYVHLQKAGKLDKKDNARETELNQAVDEFKNAVAANKMDDISWYRVGIAYALLNKVDECLDAYAKAIAINQSVAEGLELDEAVIEACAVRAKPIVLTGAAAMMGAFFILDDPIFNGLAISLIFGILVSTVLTLVVIPLLYYVLLRRTGRRVQEVHA